MKKLLILSNMLLITIILFMACNNSTPDASPKKDSSITFNTGLPVKIQPSSYATRNVTGLIEDALAVQMSNDYKNDLNKSRVSKTGQPDATAIWFDLENLKTFIAKIEAATSGGACKPKLGIKMYYAKYPADLSKWPSLGILSHVEGMHTLFMAPTYRNQYGEDVDFNFENVGSNPCVPTPYKELLAQHKKSVKLCMLGFNAPEAMANRPGVSPRVENHGGLVPPPAGEGTFPNGDNNPPAPGNN